MKQPLQIHCQIYKKGQRNRSEFNNMRKLDDTKGHTTQKEYNRTEEKSQQQQTPCRKHKYYIIVESFYIRIENINIYV